MHAPLKSTVAALAALALLVLPGAPPAAVAADAVPGTRVTIGLKGLLCGGCLGSLEKVLGKMPAVSGVATSMTPMHAALTLDEGRMSLAELTNAVDAAIKKLEPGPGTGADLVLRVDAPGCAGQEKMCPPCFTDLPETLKRVPGVARVTLDDTGKLVQVRFADGARTTAAELVKALAASPLRYTVEFAGMKLPGRL